MRLMVVLLSGIVFASSAWGAANKGESGPSGDKEHAGKPPARPETRNKNEAGGTEAPKGAEAKAEATYRKGVQAFLKGKFTTAYQALALLAENGHARAQFALSKLYARGLGVENKDEKIAAEWVKKAAEGGLSAAQYVYGDLLFRGTGVKQDRAAAAGWYQRAADQGNGEARFKLAAIYYAGEGVPKDQKRGLKLYRAAAEDGHPVAMTTMGVMYFNGGVVKKSERQARDWWLKAAYAGEVNAMVFVARIYHRSTQLPRDYTSAYVWYTMAAERGDISARKERTALERLMRSVETRNAKARLVKIRKIVR
jgi:uncharacterized protein